MNDPSRDKFQRASRVLKSLAHPLRLEMICGLRHQPCTQTFIADTLGIPQSSVAQHLKVLRSEGVVKAERRGVEVLFSLADPAVSHVIDTLCGADENAVRDQYTWQDIATLERARRASGGC
jgi:DNA-binding transcriptional ArsR family regulator